MKISFRKLAIDDFPLLLQWLNEPHVKTWWDNDIVYTKELVAEKYTNYTKSYKIEDGKHKKIDAFIISTNQEPIGYIQVYNIQDFAKDFPMANLSKESILSFDIVIGDKNYLGKSIGAESLKIFFNEFYDPEYEDVLVLADAKNIAAIKTYKKAGFIENKQFLSENKICFAKQKHTQFLQ